MMASRARMLIGARRATMFTSRAAWYLHDQYLPYDRKKPCYHAYLVVEHLFMFHNIWDTVILPIDELIFIKMVETTNQISIT